MSTPTVQVVRVGDEAPEFSLRSLDGSEVRLSEFAGRKLILFMWASW